MLKGWLNKLKLEDWSLKMACAVLATLLSFVSMSSTTHANDHSKDRRAKKF